MRKVSSKEIDTIAADWAVRIDHAPLNWAEESELQSWLAENSRHLGAYARARAVLSYARKAKALGSSFDPDEFLASQVADVADAPNSIVTGSARPSRRHFLALGGSAAAAGIVALVGMNWSASAEAFSTKRGEIRLIPLDDGSSMTLNTASRATVTFDAKSRNVELLEGEAFFVVAKDASRPFLVQTASAGVRATGTSFSVKHVPGMPVEILVREGVVELEHDKGPLNHVRLPANSRAVFPDTGEPFTAKLGPDALGRELAWREGMLSFEDTPLYDAVEQFARYSDAVIILDNAEIGAETVTGLYAANNPVGFAGAAAVSLGLIAVPTSKGILLRRRTTERAIV
jgi:transmembrane sensor